MAEGGDPPRHGAGRGRGEGGEPATTPTVGLPLQLKQPYFNWEGNVYENYKAFSERATILLGDPMLSMMTQAKSLLFSVGQETKVSNCTKT